MVKLPLAILLAGTAVCPAQEVPSLPPFAATADLGAWRSHIRPDQGDLAFEIIPWLTTLADGIRAADQEQKPLLLWVMNGHPLGCT